MSFEYSEKMNSDNPFGIKFKTVDEPLSPPARIENQDGELFLIFHDGVMGKINISDAFFEDWYANYGFYERKLWAYAAHITNHHLVFNHQFAIYLDDIYTSILNTGVYLANVKGAKDS